MTNRARAFTVRNRPGSVQIPASDLSSLNSGSDDDTFDALDDDFDTDEDFPSDSEDATNDIQLLVTPASKPQSSAFKKGHKRGQSVDHQSARRAILQEEESPSGGTGRTSSSRDLKASSNKLSNKEEKVMAKAHAREEKAAAKELKEQVALCTLFVAIPHTMFLIVCLPIETKGRTKTEESSQAREAVWDNREQQVPWWYAALSPGWLVQ